MPREFLERHVRRAYEEWRVAPLDDYLAKNAVQNANIIAARVWHYWRGRGDLSKAQGAQSEGAYRNALAASEGEHTLHSCATSRMRSSTLN